MIKTNKTGNEIASSKNLFANLNEFLKNVDEVEALDNLHLFCPRVALSRVLAIDFLYKKILSNSGIILEFGSRFGGNLALFNNLRGIYEPFNYTRKIVGFDTFNGFPETLSIDNANVNDYDVPKDYDVYLNNILEIHEGNSPVSHIKKNLLIKGDVTETLPKFLEDNCRNFALVYFDMDLYSPTLECLKQIQPFLSKGTIIVFDDFNNESFKGESKAVLDFFGNFNKFKFNIIPFYSRLSYIEIN